MNQSKSLLAFSHGTSTSIFDVRQPSKALHSLPSGPLSSPPSWSPSGRLLLSSTSALQVWDLTKAEEPVLSWPRNDQIRDLKDYPISGQARYLGARAGSWSVPYQLITHLIYFSSKYSQGSLEHWQRGPIGDMFSDEKCWKHWRLCCCPQRGHWCSTGRGLDQLKLLSQT